MYRRILKVQKVLSREREREPGLAANSVPNAAAAALSLLSSSSLLSSLSHGADDKNNKHRLKLQSIEDERGRNVGDWRERSGNNYTSALNGKMTQSTSPPPMHCADPSVALSLSIVLYSSTSTGAKENKRRLNEMNNDGGTNKGSDENMIIDGDDDKDKKEGSFQELLDEWDDMSEGQKDELKKMLGGGEDMSGK
jgi:hypothetical protein